MLPRIFKPMFCWQSHGCEGKQLFFYLMDNELMDTIWQSPTIFLHQRNKGVAKQFLLSFVFSCQTTTHANESKIDKNWLQVNKVKSFSAIDQHQVNNVGWQKKKQKSFV